MIVNCPIYLEVDQKFTPEEGREFTLGIRKAFRDNLLKLSGGIFRVRTDQGQILTIKILSEQQAINRFGSKISKVDDPPNQG